MRGTKILLTGAALGAFSVVPFTAVNAQSDTENDEASIDSIDGPGIIVTARKREENLQEVPISITAITQEDLRDANVYGLEDIAELTPGLQFRQIGGVSEVTIRGLAQTDQLGLQSNVGVFIDGVFLNNRASLEFANLDLARVEVNKGPQSALYGRDTFAGAINYVTNPARLGEFDGMVEGQVGSDDRYQIRGSVNVPIGDFGAIRAFGGYSEFDGTITNVRGGENLGGWDERITFGASALFEFEPVTLKFFYARNEIEEDNPATENISFLENNAGTSYLIPDGMGGTNTFFTVNSGPFVPQDNVNLDPRGRGNEGFFELAYANIDVDLDFATLTGTVSTSKSRYSSLFDNVGDPDAINRPFFGRFTDQFFTDQTGDVGEQDSYEIRLTSNPGLPFEWLIGYSRYNTTTGGVLGTTTPLFADPDTLEAITRVEEREIRKTDAWYGAVNIPVSDQLNVFGEIRITGEDLRLTDQADIFFFPVLSRPLTFTETDFSYASGKFGVDYTPVPGTLLYAYAARGVKSGGINGGQVQGNEFFTFNPETNWTYEAGVKTELFDGRAIINAALFYIDWTNLQSTAPASLAAGDVTVNGIGATSKGVELDASFDITDNFNIRVAATYIDATYNDGFIDGAIQARCGVTPAPVPFPTGITCDSDVSGNRIANTSEFTFFGAARYDVPELIGSFDGYIRAAYSHEGDKFATSLNLAQVPAIDLVNLRVGLTNGRTEVSLWVDNLLDDSLIARLTPITDTAANGSCFLCGISSTNIIYGNGRTFGLTLRQEF